MCWPESRRKRNSKPSPSGVSAGKLGAPLQLPFFYASPNVARVNVAMEIPSQGFKFDKVKGKIHAEMNILGIAYRADNSVARQVQRHPQVRLRKQGPGGGVRQEARPL